MVPSKRRQRLAESGLARLTSIRSLTGSPSAGRIGRLRFDGICSDLKLRTSPEASGNARGVACCCMLAYLHNRTASVHLQIFAASPADGWTCRRGRTRIVGISGPAIPPGPNGVWLSLRVPSRNPAGFWGATQRVAEATSNPGPWCGLRGHRTQRSDASSGALAGWPETETTSRRDKDAAQSVSLRASNSPNRLC